MVAHTEEEGLRNLEEIITSRRFPGVTGLSDRGIALAEEQIYREHNITHTTRSETVTATPNPPSLQCACGDCSSHRKRASITGTADVGKEV